MQDGESDRTEDDEDSGVQLSKAPDPEEVRIDSNLTRWVVLTHAVT